VDLIAGLVIVGGYLSVIALTERAAGRYVRAREAGTLRRLPGSAVIYVVRGVTDE
jgi:hypothetical protein